MPYTSRVPDEPERHKYYIGFPRGVNTYQDATLIDDKNIAQGENVMIVVDGITRRYGTDKVWDEGSANKVYGAFSFQNKSAGTRKFLRVANGALQYLNGTAWTDIAGATYSNIRTSFVQATNPLPP